MSSVASNTLDNQVAQYVKRGWRVESRDANQVVVVTGHRPNHILHLLLSLITLGIWIPIWICLSIFGGEKRKVLAQG